MPSPRPLCCAPLSRNSTPARRRFVFLTLALAAGAAGCAAAEPLSFTVAVLPDTQYYAAQHPEILEAQARFIVDARDEGAIALVVHEGDIVDGNDPRQWERAARSLHLFDGVVPYVLAAGNHDYQRVGRFIGRRTWIDSYFPPTAPPLRSLASGTFEPGRIENSFAVFDTAGGPWLVLALEFGPRDRALAWADEVLKRYATVPAIVVTHAYLGADDTRYDHRSRTDQLWNPHLYLDGAVPGAVNDGEEMWRKLIARNDNVRFVLCGHDLGDGVGRLTSTRADGTKVHQILANYQMGALGGEGYLRLMRFYPGERRVKVRTYSPYLDRWKTDPDNEFELEY
jgi:hypothetical protein